MSNTAVAVGEAAWTEANKSEVDMSSRRQSVDCTRLLLPLQPELEPAQENRATARGQFVHGLQLEPQLEGVEASVPSHTAYGINLLILTCSPHLLTFAMGLVMGP